jgi:adenylylsulfate kinase-like enzyme
VSGKVIWITGLSGAGKTTLAKQLASTLKQSGYSPVLFDGDSLRDIFGATNKNSGNFSRESRLTLAMKYCQLCKLLSDQGFLVIIATISMFKEVYAWNREYLPDYFEVYMKASLDELRRRDPKGIYYDFDTHVLANVAGLDLPVDEPEFPDFVGNIEEGLPAGTVKQILASMNKRDLFEN